MDKSFEQMYKVAKKCDLTDPDKGYWYGYENATVGRVGLVIPVVDYDTKCIRDKVDYIINVLNGSVRFCMESEVVDIADDVDRLVAVVY